MGVNHSGFNTGMAQKLLDGTNIITVFQQMSRKAVAQRVHGYALMNACAFSAFLKVLLKIAGDLPLTKR